MRRDRGALRAFPAVLVAGMVVIPVLAGLLGTALPAFGILPALGGHTLSLDPWRALLAQPGLAQAVRLTLTVGAGATVLSLAAVALFCAVFHATSWFQWMQACTAPILATPHIAAAIGFLALAAPSGVLVRLISPWVTGWSQPPDLAMVNDPWGVAMTVGLALKEAPYLLLMTVAALNQIAHARLMAVACSLGQRPATAWLKVVFPLVYRQIRLPVLAVLAYALSAVDVALVLGPDNPPPLAVLVVRWFFDPDLTRVFPAASASCTLLALTLACMVAWHGAERGVGRLGRGWAAAGGTGGGSLAIVGASILQMLLALALLSLAAAGIWSVAGPWQFPNALPQSWTLSTWAGQRAGLVAPFKTTFVAAIAATCIAMLLSVTALEAVARHGSRAWPRLLLVPYAALLVPQTSFLFGLQVALLDLGLDGGWPALIWAHLVFVLPYVLLSLAAPYAALDPRLSQIAAGLGASRLRTLVAVKLPILLRPLLATAAIGVAVSAGQYLATLFAGGGRMATLATEAVTLASGGDRRVLGVYAVMQSIIPTLFYVMALVVPGIVWRHRAGLRGA